MGVMRAKVGMGVPLRIKGIEGGIEFPEHSSVQSFLAQEPRYSLLI